MTEKVSANQSYVTADLGEKIAWIDPRVTPPPQGKKIVSLSKGGVIVVGNWDPSHLGYHYLLRMPEWLKKRIAASYLGVDDSKDTNGKG